MGICASRAGPGPAQFEQAPAAAAPAAAAPRPSGPPARVKEKLKHMQKLGSSGHPQLDQYAAAVGKMARKNLQPDEKITELDIRNLPALIAAENARHPMLKLRQFGSPDEFLRDLQTMAEGSGRAIVRMADAEGAPVYHHVTVDLQKQAGQPPTLVVLEPSSLNENTFTPHLQFYANMRRHGVDTSRVAVVEAAAQASPNDCIMYCVNFALKAMKNSGAFEDMHRNLAQQKGPGHELGLARHLAQSTGMLNHFGVRDVPGFLGNISFAAGALVLPRDFYKHASSSTLARTVDGQASSSRRHDGESLEQRVNAYKVTRPNKRGDLRTYSASIEGFRLQEIARAKRSAG